MADDPEDVLAGLPEGVVDDYVRDLDADIKTKNERVEQLEVLVKDVKDRMAVMEAFRVMAETTDARGTSLYGPNFRSLRRLSSEHNNWAGRQDCDHLHDGKSFVIIIIIIIIIF